MPDLLQKTARLFPRRHRSAQAHNLGAIFTTRLVPARGFEISNSPRGDPGAILPSASTTATRTSDRAICSVTRGPAGGHIVWLLSIPPSFATLAMSPQSSLFRVPGIARAPRLPTVLSLRDDCVARDVHDEQLAKRLVASKRPVKPWSLRRRTNDCGERGFCRWPADQRRQRSPNQPITSCAPSIRSHAPSFAKAEQTVSLIGAVVLAAWRHCPRFRDRVIREISIKSALLGNLIARSALPRDAPQYGESRNDLKIFGQRASIRQAQVRIQVKGGSSFLSSPTGTKKQAATNGRSNSWPVCPDTKLSRARGKIAQPPSPRERRSGSMQAR